MSNLTADKLTALLSFSAGIGDGCRLVLGLNSLLRDQANSTAAWDPRNARGLLRAIAAFQHDNPQSMPSVAAFGTGRCRFLFVFFFIVFSHVRKLPNPRLF